MTKSELIDAVSKANPHFGRAQVEDTVHAVFECLAEALLGGERIEIRGFGSFVVRERHARLGRNPKTGAAVSIPVRRIPFFTVGKELKQRVDGEPR